MFKPGSKPRLWNLKKPMQKAFQERTRDPFYHTARWKRESRVFLRENPLCRRCEKKGFIIPSEITDHIIPKNLCMDPWDKKNWQPLCRKCNNEKSAEDKKLIQKQRDGIQKAP